MEYKGSSFIESGYVFAPYIELNCTITYSWDVNYDPSMNFEMDKQPLDKLPTTGVYAKFGKVVVTAPQNPKEQVGVRIGLEMSIADGDYTSAYIFDYDVENHKIMHSFPESYKFINEKEVVAAIDKILSEWANKQLN